MFTIQHYEEMLVRLMQAEAGGFVTDELDQLTDEQLVPQEWKVDATRLLTIVRCLTLEEREHPEIIRHARIQDLAQRSASSIDEIDVFLSTFNFMCTLHSENGTHRNL